jgi:hypothetical protein
MICEFLPMIARSGLDLIWTQASPIVVYLSVFVHVILTTQAINFDKESLFFQGLMIMGLQVLISCLVELSVTSSVDRIGRPGFSFS